MLKAIYEDVKTCIKSPMGLTDYLPCPLGVRQGCIISPIMFTLFLNDMKDFISLDSYGVDIETIKLFVLLFADDLVIFAETVIELQRMINRLREYCNIWRLTVNLLKTKVIVFRNGGPLRNYEHWKFGEKVLDVVTYYKYLGILFSSRNSWFMAQKTLANQASKTLFAVKSKLTQFGDVNLSVLFKIFDIKILPILLYGSEIWFSHTSIDIEREHNQFCKYILRLPIYATNAFVRSELGRYKIEVFKNLKAIKYWLRLLTLPDNRLPKLCYKIQRRWVTNDTKCWLFHIRSLLFSSGFGEVWLNQGVGHENEFLKVFKQRLIDMDMQALNMDIREMDRLRTYKILKVRFGTESYLFNMKNRVLRTLFTKFRGGLLKLEGNVGRYTSIPFQDRLCPLCHSDIETEFHFLMVCPCLMTVRMKYFSAIWYTYPSIDKFIQLCNSQNLNTILNIGRYILCALKARSNLLAD